MGVLAEQPDAAVGLHGDRRVADEGLVEDLAGRPGGAVVAGHRDGAAVTRPRLRVRRVAQQQHLGARVVRRGVREGPNDLGVVHRVGQVLVGHRLAPGLPAVGGVGHLAEAGAVRGARVEHEGAVGELDDLVLVHAGPDRRSGLPGLPVVVGVDRDGLHRAAGGPDRVLLHQAPGVGAVLNLDALARGREARGPRVVLRDVRGDRAVRPGPAVVRGGRHLGLNDAPVLRVGAGLRAAPALVVGLDVEVEDRARLVVDDVARVGVADLLAGLRALVDVGGRRPGLAAVGGAALDDVVRVGGVAAAVAVVLRALVVGDEQVPVGGGGDRRDAVVVGGRVGGHVLGLAHRGRQLRARVGRRRGRGLRVVADDVDRVAGGGERLEGGAVGSGGRQGDRRRPAAGVDVGLRDRVGERLAVVDGALARLEAAPVALAAQVVEGGLGGGDVDRLVRHRAHAHRVADGVAQLVVLLARRRRDRLDPQRVGLDRARRALDRLRGAQGLPGVLHGLDLVGDLRGEAAGLEVLGGHRVRGQAGAVGLGRPGRDVAPPALGDVPGQVRRGRGVGVGLTAGVGQGDVEGHDIADGVEAVRGRVHLRDGDVGQTVRRGDGVRRGRGGDQAGSGQWQGAQEGRQAPPGKRTVRCHRCSVLGCRGGLAFNRRRRR